MDAIPLLEVRINNMNLNTFLIIVWIWIGALVVLDKIKGEKNYNFVFLEFICCWAALMIQLFKGLNV